MFRGSELYHVISEVFTYVVELNILIRTRQRVTNNTILAGTMSGGMKKDTSTLEL